MATLSREHDAENSPKALDEESWFVKHANREPQVVDPCCLNGRARKAQIQINPLIWTISTGKIQAARNLQCM